MIDRKFEWIVFSCIVLILLALAAGVFLIFGDQPLR